MKNISRGINAAAMIGAVAGLLSASPNPLQAQPYPSAVRQEPYPSFVPVEGYVPDSVTAIRIAKAVLIPIYGEEQINSEEPFGATLKDDIWTVNGHFQQRTNYGYALVRLSKRDGAILALMHFK